MKPNIKKQPSPYKTLRIFFLVLFLGSLLVLGGVALYPLVTPTTSIQPTVTPPPTLIQIPTVTPTHLPPTNIPTGTPTLTATFVGQIFTPGASQTQSANPTATGTPTPTFAPTVTATPSRTQTLPPTVTATPTPLPSTGGGEEQDNWAFSIITGPLFTALLGLLGFFSTTILQWRKESRDARNAELERKRLELEYEKNKRELEKSEEVKTKPKGIAQPGSPGARREACHLTGLKGEVAGQTYSLEDGAVIGRASQSALRLADPSASRQHARLRFAREQWFIQDMKSAGGLFVNGARVDAVALQNGDHIRVGRSEFEFREPGK